MPCFLDALTSSIAPFMTPWSVRPSAGWPKAAARSARASILQAPSRSEYSEWTCRWAQAGVLTRVRSIGGGADGVACSAGSSPHVAATGVTGATRGGLAAGRQALHAVEPAVQQGDG